MMRRAAIVAILMSCACGGGGGGGGGSCKPNVLSCTNDNECGSHQACVNNCCAAVSGCFANSECTDPAAPHCDLSTHACRACASNNECSGGKLCLPDGTCAAGCAHSTDCTDPAKPVCHSSGGLSYCAECNGNSDCKDPARPSCTAAGTCGGCGSSADCSAPTPACDTSTHLCVACLDSDNAGGVNTKCAPSTPACEGNACVVCNPALNSATDTTNGACTAPTAVCAANSTCVACIVSANDATSGANPACPHDTPVCNSDQTCVQCTASPQCGASQFCGNDHQCHSLAVSSVCVGSTATCPSSVTVANGTASVDVAARLGANASAATTVTFTITSGSASFASGSALTTTTADVAAGSNTSPAVTVYLSGSDTNDVVIQAALGGVGQSGTIHISAGAAQLATFTSDKAAIQEGKSATLTVALDFSPATDASITFDAPDAAVASLSAPSVTIASGGATSATVTLTAVAGASGTANVTAHYGAGTKDLNGGSGVTVFAVHVTSLSASPTSVAPGGTSTVTLHVDAAPPADAEVAITGTGGTFPAKVTVPAGQDHVDFTFTAPNTAGDVTVTATSAGTHQDATITVTQPAQTVMVLRVDGNGSALANAGAAVFLDEYDSVSPGAPKRSIPLPTADSGSNAGLVIGGSSTTEGALALSGDGHLVVLGGYDAAPGTATLGYTKAGTVNRIVGTVNSAGTVDTSTRMNAAFSCRTATDGSCDTGQTAASFRSATTNDGTAFWTSGNGSTLTGFTAGVTYVVHGSTGAGSSISTAISTPRHLEIFNSQLYLSADSGALHGVGTVGTGLPTTSGQTVAVVAGSSGSVTGASAYAYSFVGTDTLYVANTPFSNGTAAGTINIQKWKKITGTWTLQTAFVPVMSDALASTGAIGITAFAVNGGNRIVATTSETDGTNTLVNRLVTLLDPDDGVNNTPTVTTLATATGDSSSPPKAITAFRGVALSPTP